jgi:hypothetical protein
MCRATLFMECTRELARHIFKHLIVHAQCKQRDAYAFEYRLSSSHSVARIGPSQAMGLHRQSPANGFVDCFRWCLKKSNRRCDLLELQC